MPQPLLIVVTGVSGAGKTTLAKKISEEFQLPVVSRDQIKETMFDRLGYSTREWSHKVGLVAYDLLFFFAEEILKNGGSAILESTFKPEEWNEKFRELEKKYACLPIQIRCKTKGEVLLERFKTRSESGERHPGHVDHLNFEDYKETLSRGTYEFLDISGPKIDVDTSDFAALDYQEIFTGIRKAL